MGQVYAQPESGFHPFVLITPGLYTQVEYYQDTLIHFTDNTGSTLPDDTVKAHDPATTLLGTGMPVTPSHLFDNTYLWYVLIIPGSHKLSLVLASHMPGIDAIVGGGNDYAVLGRVLTSEVSDYEQ